jgi:hypothetical protein
MILQSLSLILTCSTYDISLIILIAVEFGVGHLTQAVCCLIEFIVYQLFVEAIMDE